MPRPPKEILFLLVLLAGAMAFVLWYVVDRRAQNRAAPPAPARAAAPAPAPGPATGAEPVDLTKTDGKTVDFSSGRPVVKDTPEDKAVIDAALKDMEEARQAVRFEPAPPPPKAAEPAKPASP